MNNAPATSSALVEAFGEEVKENRRACHHQAEKTMTRTMLLVLGFCCAVLVRFWIT